MCKIPANTVVTAGMLNRAAREIMQHCKTCRHWNPAIAGYRFWLKGDPPLKKDNQHFLITSVGHCALLDTGEVTAMQYVCGRWEAKG